MFTTHMLQNLFIACYVWVLLPPPAHWAVAVSSANSNCWNWKLIFIWCICRGGNQDILLQEPFNWSSAEEIQNITTKPTFKRVLTITAGCIFVLFNWISSLTVHVEVLYVLCRKLRSVLHELKSGSIITTIIKIDNHWSRREPTKPRLVENEHFWWRQGKQLRYTINE